MSLFIDIHALQTLPPSNINRDDTGAPKTATFGGVPRQRVSSQAWKHVMRHDLAETLTPALMGVRTKRVVQKIASKILELDESWDEARATAEAETLLKTAGIKVSPSSKKKGEDEESHLETGYLLFLSNYQIQAAAQAIIDADGEKIAKKDAQKVLDDKNSVDIALFGRMVADDAAYNVDAAAQVAHALGVAGAEPEFDFFTAVDDVVRDADETGAGMLGTVEMMSSTLYRYATVNLDGLAKNLGDRDVAVKATRAFVESFLTSMPTGKQNTFANRTLPEAIVVSVRKDRPVSLVNAFEVPATNENAGYRLQAAQKLAEEAQALDAMYGYKPEASWVVALPNLAKALDGLGTVTNLPQLLDELTATLEATESK
ncbi:type I-E CRISPR-associated protein Cas7/Cse4/CasC [Rothia nasimurium]|uniref:type I-E CRISPR-associated protein Cas7/Cse4/CasC n=1 Tax=Rothia nasimurium TaxID=85336 RepID=UPI001F016DD7|nr:type I-E CRISPR-associated protein Cas7/Cse4/CasC [Rothia nasimurium]